MTTGCGQIKRATIKYDLVVRTEGGQPIKRDAVAAKNDLGDELDTLKNAKHNAESEFTAWTARTINEPTPVQRNFVEAIRKVKRIDNLKKPARKGTRDAS